MDDKNRRRGVCEKRRFVTESHGRMSTAGAHARDRQTNCITIVIAGIVKITARPYARTKLFPPAVFVRGCAGKRQIASGSTDPNTTGSESTATDRGLRPYGATDRFHSFHVYGFIEYETLCENENCSIRFFHVRKRTRRCGLLLGSSGRSPSSRSTSFIQTYAKRNVWGATKSFFFF